MLWHYFSLLEFEKDRPGMEFCIFWGPTPASIGDEPRAASDVNVFGRVAGDASILDAISSGDEIRVTAL